MADEKAISFSELLKDNQIYQDYMEKLKQLKIDSTQFTGMNMRMPVISGATTNISSKFLLVIEDDPHMHHLYRERGNPRNPYESYCGKAITAPDTRAKKGHCPACSENWYKERGYMFPWGKY